mgnify:CR=1 FL=1
MPASSSKTVVFFDGSCPLCRAEVDIYSKHDANNRIELVDVSDVTAELPSSLDRKQAMARFHVKSSDGHLLSGAEAFVEVWQQLPVWSWVAKLVAIRSMTFVIELFYRTFLFIRPILVHIFLIIRRLSRRSSHPT